MQLTGKKFTAARALLEWTLDDLAERSGVSRGTLVKLEKDQGTSFQSTLDTVRKTFEDAGIEFTARGVQMSEETVTFLDGPDGYIQMLQDAARILKKGDEILFSGADDRKSSPEVTALVGRMQAGGIETRFLIEEDNTYILGDIKDYRAVPSDYFAKHDVTVIYADRIAFYIPADPPRVMIVRNQYVANDYRGIFEYFWDNGAIPGA